MLEVGWDLEKLRNSFDHDVYCIVASLNATIYESNK